MNKKSLTPKPTDRRQDSSKHLKSPTPKPQRSVTPKPVGFKPPARVPANQVKWVNWRLRSFYTFLMIFAFILILALGPLATILLVLFLQTLVFRELISISASSSKSKDLPWQRSLSWYLMIVTTNSLYGNVFYKYMLQMDIPAVSNFIYFCIKHQKFVTVSLYIIGFVWFVATLRVGYYKFQLAQLSWTLMLLFFVIYQSHFMVDSILEGMFWFIIPSFLVVVNDIFAYVFGFFFGRHQLIQLSPKKTWEGFVGGAFSTIVFAFFITPVLSKYSFFICPPKSILDTAFNFPTCTPNSVFVQYEYILPAAVSTLAKILGYNIEKVVLFPIQLHSMALALFASLIAPFGGFFASGVKRALKIKDFGDSIPGHGGVTDRFDCQFMMAAFSHIYYVTFIRASGIPVARILTTIINNLSLDDKISLYQSLGQHLSSMNISSSP